MDMRQRRARPVLHLSTVTTSHMSWSIVSMFIRNQGNKDKIQLGLNDTPRSQGALSVWFLYLVATMLLQLS